MPSPPPIIVQVASGGPNLDWLGWVLTGLFTLAGVALGYFFNQRAEKRKAEREKLQRWDQNVLNHTSNVMSLAREFIHHSLTHESVVETLAEVAVQQMDAGEQIDPPPVNEASSLAVYESFDALMSESSTLQLVAPQSVRELVIRVQRSAGDLFFAKDEDNISDEIEHLHDSLNELEAAVRSHFGIN